MAQLGAPDGVELLLRTGLDQGNFIDDRQIAAAAALNSIFLGNAIAPVAARLSVTAPESAASLSCARILIRIGTNEAAQVLIKWLRACDASIATVVPDLVSSSGTPQMLDSWRDAVAPEVPYRAEAIREGIRKGLAD